MSWKTPVFSIFKVRKEEKGLFTLLNLVNNQKYIAIKEENYSFNIGTFIIARILPFNNNQYIFCGNKLILNIKNNFFYFIVLIFKNEAN